jgi:hypothetical protein
VTEFGAKCYKPQLLGGLIECFLGVFNRVFHSFCGLRFLNPKPGLNTQVKLDLT